jgi:ubiquinone/menaquinone biosynthesis C-methylase UbiE
MNSDWFRQKLIARFMRAFFYLLYQPMAWSYDLVAAVVSWGRWKQWVFSVLPYLEGPRVLEIGHGPGHLQIALQSKGVTTLGLDASHQMGQQARKRLTKRRSTPYLIRGYAQNLPLSDDIFDQVVATFPTEYIYAAESLAEIFRTLKPGGTLVVLPAAWITGKRPWDRGTAALFRITGQAPEWDEKWLEPFLKAGFDSRAEMIRHNTWSLVIILARKPHLQAT